MNRETLNKMKEAVDRLDAINEALMELPKMRGTGIGLAQRFIQYGDTQYNMLVALTPNEVEDILLILRADAEQKLKDMGVEL